MIIQQVNLPVSFEVPNIDQFFGLWSVMPDRMCQLLSSLQFYNFNSHLQAFQQQQQQADDGSSPGFNLMPGGIARIDLSGMLTKKGSSLSQQGSTVRARRAIRNASNDPNVGGILLVIESPGGTVQGTKELADDVFTARSVKPVLTYYEDTGGSAAYFIGSQATESYANESAIIGSIGTLLTLVDSSEAAANAGLKVHVISTGEFKGAGVPGSAITKNQLAMFRGLINDGNELFLEGVSRGREMSMSQVRQVATGEVFLASNAVANGLIDGVARFEDAVDRLRFMIEGKSMTLGTSPNGATASIPSFSHQAQFQPSQQLQGGQLPQQVPHQAPQLQQPIHQAAPIQQPQASPAQAAVQQLQQACPGAPPEFIIQQILVGASPTSAQAAYIGHQQRQLVELQQQVQGLQSQPVAQVPQPAPVAQVADPYAVQQQQIPQASFFMGGPVGNDPIMSAAVDNQYGDAISQWEMQIAKNESNGYNRRDATLKADADNPGLRQQMLMEKQQLSMSQR